MRRWMKGAALLATMAAATFPVAAQAPALAMLDSLDKGAWSLQLRSDDSVKRICVRTGREFIQLQHAQRGCSRFVTQDDENEVTVQYNCRGNGYGRTTIRREGSGVVQIRSQGIYSGTPFSIDAEARHIGRC